MNAIAQKRMITALAASLMLAGCAGTANLASHAQADIDPMADPLIASDDMLTSAAALLVAAQAAPDAASRAPVMERLLALNVQPADAASDNPLAQWRTAHAPYAGTPYRGRTLGPAYRRANLAPGQMIEIAQVFYAGRRAEMRAQANRSTVALAINNSRDEAVCQAQLSPQAQCRWLPLFTERFAITLENTGDMPASVYLVFE